jgi:carbon-monoxide dehydrogenase small subunit
MTYRLSGGEAGAPTHVEVVSEINLAGALAQFGKAGVISEIAGRLTDEFVRNFEVKLAPPEAEVEAAPAPLASPRSLDLGSLIWTMLKHRIRSLIRRLTGRAA